MLPICSSLLWAWKHFSYSYRFIKCSEWNDKIRRMTGRFSNGLYLNRNIYLPRFVCVCVWVSQIRRKGKWMVYIGSCDKYIYKIKTQKRSKRSCCRWLNVSYCSVGQCQSYCSLLPESVCLTSRQHRPTTSVLLFQHLFFFSLCLPAFYAWVFHLFFDLSSLLPLHHILLFSVHTQQHTLCSTTLAGVTCAISFLCL